MQSLEFPGQKTPKKKKPKHAELLDASQRMQVTDGMLTNRRLKEAAKSAKEFFETQKE